VIIGTLNEFFMVWALKYSMKLSFRVCLIGEVYQALKSCDFIPKERLGDVEVDKSLEEFKNKF